MEGRAGGREGGKAFMLPLIMVIGFPENSLTSPLVIKRSVVGIPEAMEGSGGKWSEAEGSSRERRGFGGKGAGWEEVLEGS